MTRKIESSQKAFWRDRSIFVTGATGFLGSSLVAALVARGAKVVCLIRDHVHDSSLIRSGMLSQVNAVYGDLSQADTLERCISEYEVDTVFHLAAQAIVGAANRNPVATFTANIEGTWNVLEACRRLSTVSRIIVASSDKAYGEHRDLPYEEDFPLRGLHPYDVSKSCTDLLSLTYHHTYGLPVAITRCGNLFGGGDMNFNRIVPGTVKSVFNGERPIIRSDGSPLRDYIYVRDAVDAYLLLAEKMSEKVVLGNAFNFGTSRPLSVLEITSKILKMMNRTDLEPVVLNEAHGEIMHQYLSSEKAKRMLGWEPAASIDDGLKQTIVEYLDYFGMDTSRQ
jgi:CDP-glucose 4,6-dehydratase